METQILLETEYLLSITREVAQLTGLFIVSGFAAATLLSLLGYGIFKAVSLVNIIAK